MDAMTDAPRFVITVLMACWALAFAYAFWAFATTEPTGDGFARGVNRISAYLGWQAIAGMFAIAIAAVGRGWPKGSGVRRLAWVPLGLALTHVAAVVGLFAWAQFAS